MFPEPLHQFYNVNGDLRSVDFFLRLENLTTEIETICDILNIEFNPGLIQHSKKTEHKKYIEYFTSEIESLVYPYVKEDAEVFQYTLR